MYVYLRQVEDNLIGFPLSACSSCQNKIYCQCNSNSSSFILSRSTTFQMSVLTVETPQLIRITGTEISTEHYR